MLGQPSMAWLPNLSLLDSFQLSLALPLCPYSLSLSWAVARTPSLCPAELLLSLLHCNSDPIAALLSPRAPYCLNKASPQLLGELAPAATSACLCHPQPRTPGFSNVCHKLPGPKIDLLAPVAAESKHSLCPADSSVPYLVLPALD